MLMKEQAAAVRVIESQEDFAETRLEAIGFVFHGTIPLPDAKRTAVKAGTNQLHFARCAKLDKVGDAEDKVWYRTVHAAKKHLDEVVGANRWKWCKICEREVTQKILNEQ